MMLLTQAITATFFVGLVSYTSHKDFFLEEYHHCYSGLYRGWLGCWITWTTKASAIHEGAKRPKQGPSHINTCKLVHVKPHYTIRPCSYL